MSDRNRKLVWIVGVVTLLAGGFFMGRLFSGDSDAAPAISGNEIADSTDGWAPTEKPPRIPKEPEKGDGRLVTTPSDVADVNVRHDGPKIVRRGNARSGSRGKDYASGDPVPEEEEKPHVPRMGAVEL